jgi:hypothetical protein
MRGENETRAATGAPLEAPPRPTAHQFGAVQQDNVVRAQFAKKPPQKRSGESRRAVVEAQRFHVEPARAQKRSEVFEQRRLSRTFGADDGGTVVQLCQPRQQLVPRHAAQTIPHFKHAVGGERVVTGFHWILWKRIAFAMG